jgi:argininosuccinate synthase
VLEDPAEPAPAEIFLMTFHPQDAPETPCKLQINFEHGIVEYCAEIKVSSFLKIYYVIDL